MSKLKWFVNRLKAMSVKEVFYRLEQKNKKIKYKKKYNNSRTVLDIKDYKYNQDDYIKCEKILSQILNNCNLEELEINNKTTVYNTEFDIFEPIKWHKAMNGEWPKDKVSFDIEFKESVFGDVRYTWEVNRHLFFPRLALYYKKYNDEKYIDQLKKLFYDWVQENPFLKGVNWSSPMEIAIRAYQWLITLSLLSESEDVNFKKDLIKAILNSIEYVSENLSAFSSANNHLILEAGIISIIGYCLEPIYKQHWFKVGNDILKKEIPLQVYEDGVNKEQAAHYHAFVLDIMLQYNIFLKKINKETLHEDILYKMTEFIGYAFNNNSAVEFGDSDDAKILDFTGYKKNYYKFLLKLSSCYYEEKFIDIGYIDLEIKLLIDNKCDAHSYKKYEYNNLKVFNQGGYAFIKQKNDFLMFDFGNLGFGSIAAHGHADALSIVYHNKKPIFIDLGTYIYNVQKKWRDYFRKTENHNTLYIEGKCQSKMEGPFLWSKKADAKLIDCGENKSLIYLKASHDGYLPSIHERTIAYEKKENFIIIEDSFSNEGILNFNIDINVEINQINKNLIKCDDIYFYCSKDIEIIDKSISKEFLLKEKTKALKIKNNFNEEKVYSIIAKEPISFKNNEIIFEDKKYQYINYNEIRGVSREKC